MKTIQFTPDKLLRFKAAHAKAVKAGAESFTFDGEEWVTKYAQYAIEYLDLAMKERICSLSKN